ncbi:dihydrolipoyl dehydrogenase [Pseudorhodoferax sp. Leaf265]|uniref:dihydrolipoyl dehydrogenase n=1 Tax=Pseudorhodoferax sp. Leaf265 TaxID=1736315 RepID=UPI0006FD8C8E|nr:dihydrolipoyl dehydrogenase [Pseudorhodoferax sp. Leaf265]KQP02423.1 dihydrolipoamide dehydrogenase [Pseudorhodoferax sp. Leaf265]
MASKTTTLLVIGGGPGGYVAAIRAAQLGVATTLVEGVAPGGTCLNIGCIPSKALIHAADEYDRVRRATTMSPLGIRAGAAGIDLAVTQAWKEGVVGKLTGGVAALLRKAGVQVVAGWARIVDGKTVDVAREDGETQRIQCEHLLLAAGSEPMALPQLPFGGKVLSSTEALALTEVPRHLVVVGAGYIGLELGMAWRKLGAEVTVVDVAERVLPGYDEDLGKPVLAAMKRMGIVLHLGCTAEGLTTDGSGLRVRSRHADEFVLPADQVLVAAGRRPRTAGLESLQLDMDGGAVKVDATGRTSMRNVWAIGDLTGEPMLAHRAMAQGEVAAECIAGHKRRFAPLAIPAVCFTDPEVVAVGLTQAQAAQAGIETLSAQFPFAANGRSLTMEGGEGFVRVVARQDNHLVLGWQAVGQGVSELAAAFSYAIEMGARLEDVGGIVHAHPTLGEAVQEAALRALGRAIHL